MKKSKTKISLIGSRGNGKTYGTILYIAKKYYGIKWLFLSKRKKQKIIYELSQSAL